MAARNKSATLEEVNQKPRLSLQSEVIAEDTSTIRSLDWDRSRFDIEFGLRNGTTYNSFLIKGAKNALIDTSHIKFSETWFIELKKLIEPTKINYLIVSHTEPDHSGLISKLLDLNPKIEIIGSKVAIKYLEDQVHRPFLSRPVKNGEKINLGINESSGIDHCIEFLSAPNLHWPDTIFSFDHGSRVLYTCDAFGLHYCSDQLYDANQNAIAPDFRFYYDCLMGPNARSVIQALKKIDKLPEITAIAVGHGPLLKYHLNTWLCNYENWSKERNKSGTYVGLCYISQHGFCDQLSQAISHGIGKADVQVQLIDLQSSDSQELNALISEATAVIMPTWPNQPEPELQSSIGTVFASLKKKQWVGVYESYGGNDEPIDVITNRLQNLGQKEAFTPLRVRGKPDSNTYQRFEETGTDLGQLLNRKKNIATIKQLDGELTKAMGRLSGGLYIVTASQGEGKSKRSSAMVASWVSQASFNPPGITVAVAKDRAIEALMQVGDKFIINILEEDNYIHLFRHFLKRFLPGVDRFKGVDFLENVAQGGPVLVDALAFLGCEVKQRLETPDHWIIYALVKQGNVANSEAKTAVHHRRVGSNY